MNAYRNADDHDHDEDDWEDDREEDREDDVDDPGHDDEEPTLPCPWCRREILEDSPYCPHCGRYVSEEERAGQGKPLWVFLTALVCLGIAIWWVFAVF